MIESIRKAFDEGSVENLEEALRAASDVETMGIARMRRLLPRDEPLPLADDPGWAEGFEAELQCDTHVVNFLRATLHEIPGIPEPSIYNASLGRLEITWFPDEENPTDEVHWLMERSRLPWPGIEVRRYKDEGGSVLEAKNFYHARTLIKDLRVSCVYVLKHKDDHMGQMLLAAQKDGYITSDLDTALQFDSSGGAEEYLRDNLVWNYLEKRAFVITVVRKPSEQEVLHRPS